jgi:hypothetical protein
MWMGCLGAGALIRACPTPPPPSVVLGMLRRRQQVRHAAAINSSCVSRHSVTCSRSQHLQQHTYKHNISMVVWMQQMHSFCLHAQGSSLAGAALCPCPSPLLPFCCVFMVSYYSCLISQWWFAGAPQYSQEEQGPGQPLPLRRSLDLSQPPSSMRGREGYSAAGPYG